MAAWKMVEKKSEIEQKLNEDLLAINEEYQATNEDLMSKNEDLITSEDNLQNLLDIVHEKEQLFRMMIEQSPVTMASLKSKDLVIDAVNIPILQIWGKDHSVMGLPLEDTLPELRAQRLLEILKNCYATGVAFHGKEMNAKLLLNGEIVERYLNFVYQPTQLDENGERSILIVANDVTELVNSRKEADEMNTRLEIALDASKLGSTEVYLPTGVIKST